VIKATNKNIFVDFLNTHLPDKVTQLLPLFEQYLEELYTQNQMVNMVSRKMTKEDYWTYHFLDSLLVLKCMELQGEAALDFGSGGGLPGIPLKLVLSEMQMTLLDSVGKKVKCMQSIVESLQLKGCNAVWARLEDYVSTGAKFDYIFCRSVRLEHSFIKPLCKLLKPNGKAVFYKANQTEDVAILPKRKTFDVSQPELGKRQIVVVSKKGFEYYLYGKEQG
jgi:16S rRNA (guanine527-N7)-methyltransferase